MWICGIWGQSNLILGNMSARKRKAVPARLSPSLGSETVVVGCAAAEVNGYSGPPTGSGNGDEPEVGWCHVSGDVMESIRSLIGAAPTMADKQRRLNAMIHQLQAIRNQLTGQHQQVRFLLRRDISHGPKANLKTALNC